MEISDIFAKLQALKMPASASQIDKSEAICFLKKLIESADNETRNSAFNILITRRKDFLEQSKSLEYIIEIIRKSNFDIEMSSSLLFNMSMCKNDNIYTKKQYYFLLSVIYPKLFSNIVLRKSLDDFGLYLSVMSSFFHNGDSDLIKDGIENLIEFIDVLAESSTELYDSILYNNLDLVLACAKFPGCDPEYASYLSKIVEIYSEKFPDKHPLNSEYYRTLIWSFSDPLI
jgi:hypothetical protein